MTTRVTTHNSTEAHQLGADAGDRPKRLQAAAGALRCAAGQLPAQVCPAACSGAPAPLGKQRFTTASALRGHPGPLRRQLLDSSRVSVGVTALQLLHGLPSAGTSAGIAAAVLWACSTLLGTNTPANTCPH